MLEALKPAPGYQLWHVLRCCLKPLEELLAEVLTKGHEPGELDPGLLHSLLVPTGWVTLL